MELHEVGTDGGPHTMWEGSDYQTPEASGTTVDTGGLHDDGSTAFDGGHDSGSDGTDGDTAIDGQETSAGAGADGGHDSGSMTVEVDGQTRTLPTTHDYDGDGRPDAAVETPDGRLIVFTDTHDNSDGSDGADGTADEAYILDKSGHVVGAAHIDPSTGEWVDGAGSDAAGSGAGAGGPSAGDSDSGDAPTTDSGTVGGAPTSGAPTSGAPTSGGPTGGGPTGDAPTSGGSGDTGGSDTTQAPQVVTVEVGGHEIGVAETIDSDHDGTNDTGVLEADGKTIALTDTDGDGDADKATVFDQSGQVVGAMHVDASTGEWVVDGGSAAGTGSTDTGDSGTGTGAGDGGEVGTTSTSGGDAGDSGGPGDSGGAAGGTGSMTVEVDGQSRVLPTTHDYTGDGQPDAAVQTADGRTIVFTDTHDNSTGTPGPDGTADEAFILDSSGHVVGAAHIDPSTGEWVDGTEVGSPAPDTSTV
jgi:hypothetical protein